MSQAQSHSSGNAFSSSTMADAVVSTQATERLNETAGANKRTFLDMSTTDAYNAWAETYDNDGNILQAIDDICLSTLLPSFLSQVQSIPPSQPTIVDLGCGTGRNTLPLLDYPWPPSSTNHKVTILGIDASSAMLAQAQAKCSARLSLLPGSTSSCLDLRLEQHDLLSGSGVPERYKGIADGVISTLVLEHIPLSTFFTALNSLLRLGGTALITNMHPDMGARTQAGFVNAAGERVRGTSFVYGMQETVDAAVAAGFDIVGEVREQVVEESFLVRIGKRGQKWVGVRVWYGLVIRKRTE